MMFCGVHLGWEVSLCSIKDCLVLILLGELTLALFPLLVATLCVIDLLKVS